VRIGDPRQLTPADRQKLGLSEDQRLRGAVVFDVIAGGPADKAGIRSGDLIEAFEGQPIERSSRVSWLASTTGVGRTVTLRVQRGSQHLDLKVTLGRLDAPTSNPR
jgi:S1-C subfamily serine protease